MTWIIHSDINSCYALTELVFRPDLRDKPVVVGGSEKARSVSPQQKSEESVSQLKTANEQLNLNMNNQIEALTSGVKTETIKAVKNGLKENIDQLAKATKKLEDYEKSISSKMQISLENFKEKQDKFFEFDSFRSVLFWAGSALNILTFGLLVCFLFFRG